MQPALLVLLGFALFFGTHVGLGTAPVRDRLVARLGERRFVDLFSLVATLTFGIWVVTTAAVRHEGWPGPGAAGDPLVRGLGIAAIAAGFALGAGSLAEYARSPMALFVHRTDAPRGLARITRHGFFAGVALFGLGHVPLAPSLASATFFAGLAAHAVIGAVHQDRKLRRKLGAPYEAYLEQTSGLPFAAILSGRQRLVWGEQPWLALGVGLLLAFALRQVHEHVFAFGGLPIVVAVAGGGALAAASAERAARRQRRVRHA